MSNCYCIPVNDYLNIRFVEKRKTLLHLGEGKRKAEDTFVIVFTQTSIPFNPRQMETICRVNGVVNTGPRGFPRFAPELTETLEYHFYGWLSAVGTY